MSYAGPKIAADNSNFEICIPKMFPDWPYRTQGHTPEPFAIPADAHCSIRLDYLRGSGAERRRNRPQSQSVDSEHSIWLIARTEGGGGCSPAMIVLLVSMNYVPAGGHRILSTLVRVSHKPNSSCRRPCVAFGCGSLGNHF